MNFSDLGLKPEILRAIEDAGYTEPTQIQETAIPYILQQRDVLGTAQTGTGKTASFTLPMIDILASGRAKARMPRSLILAPTRELAAQVADNFEIYGKYERLTYALLIGGERMDEQSRKLDRGVDVLIATPGRMLDMHERGKILLRDVKILVIDEADRMLDMGFIPDIEKIVGLLPVMRQTLLFSATMPKEIRRLAERFLMNPKEVYVERKSSAADTVVQRLIETTKDQKRAVLRDLLRAENLRNALVFCNRKRDVSIVSKSLTRHKFSAGELHGDMPQSARTETLQRFKDGEIKVLVCSDVAARGIDIDDLSHVFNFDVPTHSEDYVHRIGRTGRAGREGRSFTLATADDAKYVTGIEKLIGNRIPRFTPESTDTPAEAAPAQMAAPQDSAQEPPRKPPRRRKQSAAKSGASKPATETPAESEAQAPAEAGHDAPEYAPTPASKRPSKGRGRRKDTSDRSADSVTETPAAPPQENRGRQPTRRGGKDDGDKPVVGLGDHVPAFLLRPVPKSASTPPKKKSQSAP